MFYFVVGQPWTIWKDMEKKPFMGLWDAGGGGHTPKANTEIGQTPLQKESASHYMEVCCRW